MKMTRSAWLAATVLAIAWQLHKRPLPRKSICWFWVKKRDTGTNQYSDAMAVIEQLGEKTGLWDTTIRTDTEILTKKKLEYNAKNLNDFDAIFMFTGGDPEMDAQQKADFLSFIHDDGKGLIGVHAAAITWVHWPEFVDLLGGDFDEHPWLTFDAPIIVETEVSRHAAMAPRVHPARRDLPDEGLLPRQGEGADALDPCKLDLADPKVHRKDRDLLSPGPSPMARGVFITRPLDTPKENWDDPRVQKMYTEAIKWAMGLESADITACTRPPIQPASKLI